MPQSLRHAVKGGYSLSQKRISPFGTPRERLRLAVSGLRKSLASGMEMLARSVAAFRVATRLASAPTIRCCTAVGGFAALRMRHTPCGCRSAHLVEVRSNFRLPPVSTMRRAPAMPHLVSSLPPFYRHSRLTTVRRGCWMCRIAGIHGEAMYTAPTLRSACSHSSCKLTMYGVKGPSPLRSLGGSRGPFSHVREWPPLFALPARPQGIPFAPYGATI